MFSTDQWTLIFFFFFFYFDKLLNILILLSVACGGKEGELEKENEKARMRPGSPLCAPVYQSTKAGLFFYEPHYALLRSFDHNTVTSIRAELAFQKKKKKKKKGS
ncbi:hypothetical protein MVEG_08794 [Podila verticillata NRRL 6337]|nr:hypothetical protein MVEG_08794 [Podila verticillata NRRL 6337]